MQTPAAPPSQLERASLGPLVRLRPELDVDEIQLRANGTQVVVTRTTGL